MTILATLQISFKYPKKKFPWKHGLTCNQNLPPWSSSEAGWTRSQAVYSWWPGLSRGLNYMAFREFSTESLTSDYFCYFICDNPPVSQLCPIQLAEPNTQLFWMLEAFLDCIALVNGAHVEISTLLSLTRHVYVQKI